MDLLTLGEIASATGGRLRGRPPGVAVGAVGTDSRAASPGQLFVALRGGRADGHDHALEAIARGAAAALVARGRIPADQPGAYVEVDDPLAALGRLAAAYRLRFPALKVVAVTGSNGKTTAKEMLAAICAAAGPTIRSPKSYNNAIGLPLTCLHLGRATRYAVLEMGANAPGEIAALAAIARPDVGVVTNVGRAHLGGFGGTLEAVARAKGELVEAVAAQGGTVVLNADDVNSAPLFARAKGARVVAFGREPDLPLPPSVRGRHNEMNALAALAAAGALGIPRGTALSGLGRFTPPPMRLEETTVAGIRLVNDAYNANPDSLQAGLDWLGLQDGRRVACLGGMEELGGASEALHREAGAAAAKAGVALLAGVGAGGRWIVEGYRAAGGARALALPEAESAGSELARLLEPGDVALFKASRASGLERAVAACAAGLGKGA